MVPSPRRPLRRETIHDVHRHVERGMHIRWWVVAEQFKLESRIDVPAIRAELANAGRPLFPGSDVNDRSAQENI